MTCPAILALSAAALILAAEAAWIWIFLIRPLMRDNPPEDQP